MRWIALSLVGVMMPLLSPAIGGAASPSDGGASIIVERNLFNPNRSVPPPPKPQAPKPVAQPLPPPPRFELSGVVKVEGESSLALLQEPRLTNGNPTVLNLGDSLGGYKLVAIEHDRVRLESETGTVTVLLYDPTKTRKPGVAASLRARELPTPQPGVPPTAARVQAPAVQAPPAPEQPAASAEAAPAEQNTEPNEAAKEGSPILKVLEKGFGALLGQERLPIFTGGPRRGQ